MDLPGFFPYMYSKFVQSRQVCIAKHIMGNIPEQFTVKTHPALFEGEGRGKNIEEHFSQLTQEYWVKTFPS